MTASPPASFESVTGSSTHRSPSPITKEQSGLRHFPLRWSDARRLFLAYAVFSVVGIIIGELIVHPLRHTWLVRSDESIERWLADHRTPWPNTATLIAVVAGSSRMYRGMHHLSDVIAGVMLGLVTVFATRAVLLSVDHRERAQAEIAPVRR